MKSRKLLPALSLIAVLAAALPLSASGTVGSPTPSLVAPRPGLVVRGSVPVESGSVTVTLRVNSARSLARQSVDADVRCDRPATGQRPSSIDLGPRRGMRIRYTYNRKGASHGRFGPFAVGTQNYTVTGVFITSTTAHVEVHMPSSVQYRCFGLVVKQFGRFFIPVKHVLRRGTTPPTWPPVTLTQCPSPDRAQALPPGAKFTVKGMVAGGAPPRSGLHGEIANVTYETLQGASGKPNKFTSYSYVQPDGTFTANFTVPLQPGITAEASIDASVFPGQHKHCNFYDR